MKKLTKNSVFLTKFLQIVKSNYFSPCKKVAFNKLKLYNTFVIRRIKMIEYRYDTQLLIEGKNLDEKKIREYFNTKLVGDCLIAVGDDELIKIHFHTNEPWKVLEYCSSLGEIFDIVVEDMDRQSRGLQG